MSKDNIGALHAFNLEKDKNVCLYAANVDAYI